MPQRARHALEEVVARLVAEGVVDVLEVVQVDHEHGARGAVARHPLGLPGQLLLETPPVEEPGQEIVIDQVLEALRQLLALGDVLDLRDDIEGLAPVVADERHRQQHPEVMAPGMAVALLDLVAGNPAVEQLAQGVRVEIDVLGMRDGPQRRRLELVPGMPGDPAERIVDLQPAALHVHESHADRRIGECALEPRMHLVQTPLGRPPRALEPLALGHPATKLRVGHRELLLRPLVLAERALEHACRGPRADGLPRSPRPVLLEHLEPIHRPRRVSVAEIYAEDKDGAPRSPPVDCGPHDRPADLIASRHEAHGPPRCRAPRSREVPALMVAVLVLDGLAARWRPDERPSPSRRSRWRAGPR